MRRNEWEVMGEQLESGTYQMGNTPGMKNLKNKYYFTSLHFWSKKEHLKKMKKLHGVVSGPAFGTKLKCRCRVLSKQEIDREKRWSQTQEQYSNLGCMREL